MKIRAHNFSVSIKGNTVTTCENFEVKNGEIVQLVGENGSGKTAFLECCAGIIPHITGGHIRGELFIGGDSLDKCSSEHLQGKVVYIPSAIDMFFMCNTPFDELVFTLAGCNPRLGLDEIYLQAKTIIDNYQLSELKDWNISELSYGQRAKVALVCAVASQAPVLLLDEVMSSLDSQIRIEIQTLINGYIHSGGLCIVADHDYAWDNAQVHRFEGTFSPPSLPTLSTDRKQCEGARGKLVTLSGDNGSGKTTLLRHFAGFVGSSRLHSHALNISRTIDMIHPLAYMPQECRHVFRQRTLRAELHSASKEIIHKLCLDELLDKNPLTLSYGQQKRATLAMTMAAPAQTFLLDEPTRGLDRATNRHVVEFLSDFAHDNNVLIVCATHESSLIAASEETFSLLDLQPRESLRIS